MGRRSFSVIFLLINLVFFTNLWARGGGGCFLSDTPIMRADGSSVSIDHIQPGDQVLAFRKNGSITKTTVRAVLTHHVASYFHLETDHLRLNVTGTHPFYVGFGRFKKVDDLAKGDAIYAYDGHSLHPQIIRIKQRLTRNTLVYNLKTNVPHTYFASGVAVHNKGGGGGGGRGGHGFYGGRGRSCPPGDLNCQRNETFSLIFFLGLYAFIYCLGRWNKKSEDLDYLNTRYNIEKKSSKTLTLLRFIAKQDGSFIPDTLTQHTREVFTKLQTCWSNREYEPMQDLLMPDLYKQHCRQLDGMRKNHEINRLKNLMIQKIDLVNVRYTEKKFNREFTALITASVQDYYVDSRSEKFLRGNKTPKPFQEFWTFQLQPTGWKLRDIEQAKESDYLKVENFFETFTDPQVEKIYQSPVDKLGQAGPDLPKIVSEKENKVDRMLNFLIQSNPMWNRQEMVIRVRSVFTDVHMALEAGVLDPATEACLFPTVATQMKERLNIWKAGGHSIEYRNFCVRKIEIVLVKSYDDKTQNEFTARVSAHAQIVQLNNDTVIAKDEDVTPFIELWTFGCLDNEWKLKEAEPQGKESEILATENTEEGSSPNLIKWYYSKKRG